jgi:transcriptional regulator with XRE-family HTH domain
MGATMRRRMSADDYPFGHAGDDSITSRVMAPVIDRPYSGAMARPAVGDLLRHWRTRRRRSQMDLALDVGVSTRHLSFVETGRSRPSPELVLAIAHHLEVPLRERNGLLLAAGYAPRFSQMSLDDPAMAHVRASIQRMLDAHDPYPGAVSIVSGTLRWSTGLVRCSRKASPPTCWARR